MSTYRQKIILEALIAHLKERENPEEEWRTGIAQDQVLKNNQALIQSIKDAGFDRPEQILQMWDSYGKRDLLRRLINTYGRITNPQDREIAGILIGGKIKPSDKANAVNIVRKYLNEDLDVEKSYIIL